MNINYRRDMYHHELVIDAMNIPDHHYELQMLERNSIPHFIPVSLRVLDGQEQLCFNITGMQSLHKVYAGRTLKTKDLKMIFGGLKEVLEEAEQYLLRPENILFLPETLFIGKDETGLQVCCAFQEKDENDILKLAEFLLRHLDHADHTAVQGAYLFYQEAIGENFSLPDTLRKIEALPEQDCITSIRGVGPDVLYDDNLHLLKEQEALQNLGTPLSGGTLQSPEMLQNREIQIKKENRQNRQDQQGRTNRKNRKNTKNQHNQQNHQERQNQHNQQNHQEWQNQHNQKNLYNRKNLQNHTERKTRRLKIIVLLGIGAVLLTGNVIFYLFADPDLTQIGGMAFLSGAIFWFVMGILFKNKKENRNIWITDRDEENDPDLKELLEDVYDQDAVSDDYPRKSEKHSQQTGQHMDLTEEEKHSRQTGQHLDFTEEEMNMTRCIMPEEDEESTAVLVCERYTEYEDLLLDAQHIVIGKTKKSADRVIKAAQISRYHACIDEENSSYFLTDLNSRNGTFCNGKRLEPFEKTQIHNGDKIAFADINFIAKNL